MTNWRFDELFGAPPRQLDTQITRREIHLAASVHPVKGIVLKLVKRALELTGERSLVMAGGVALTCVANGRVLRESKLDGSCSGSLLQVLLGIIATIGSYLPGHLLLYGALHQFVGTVFAVVLVGALRLLVATPAQPCSSKTERGSAT